MHYDDVQIALAEFIGAFALSYGAMRLLWGSVAASGTGRGVILAAPVAALAVFFAAIGMASTGVAFCLGAAVLMLTLGTGVAAMGRPHFDYTIDASTPHALRLVPPLAATVCAAGFNGGLTLLHLIATALVGGLSLWSAVPNLKPAGSPAAASSFARKWKWRNVAVSAALLAAAVALVVFAGGRFQAAAGANVVTPLVVLLAAPALLLSVMGLLSSESSIGHFAAAGDTVAGFVLATLGGALPATIAIGLARQWAAVNWADRIAATLHLTLQPAPVMMPVATWRIDSLLLLVTAVLLAPAARMRLGRAEGTLLVGIYLAYAAVASRSGQIM